MVHSENIAHFWSPSTPTSPVIWFLSSSVGGLILDKTVTNPNFVGMAVFTPVINGEVTPEEGAGQQLSLTRLLCVRIAVRCCFIPVFKPHLLK